MQEGQQLLGYSVRQLPVFKHVLVVLKVHLLGGYLGESVQETAGQTYNS